MLSGVQLDGCATNGSADLSFIDFFLSLLFNEEYSNIWSAIIYAQYKQFFSSWVAELAKLAGKKNQTKLSLQLQEALCIAHKRRVERVADLQTQREKQFGERERTNSFQSSRNNPFKVGWRDKLCFALILHEYKVREMLYKPTTGTIKARVPRLTREQVRNLCTVPQSMRSHIQHKRN